MRTSEAPARSDISPTLDLPIYPTGFRSTKAALARGRLPRDECRSHRRNELGAASPAQHLRSAVAQQIDALLMPRRHRAARPPKEKGPVSRAFFSSGGGI